MNNLKNNELDFNRICFFCSEEIQDKKTMEHIIPNSLLGKLGIKEERLSGEYDFLYSRIKVPAHLKCNNEFGSRYEKEILNLLENPKFLYKQLLNEDCGIPLRYGPEYNLTAKLTTWILKIYYGLFYHDLLKTKNIEWKNICKHMIGFDNFKLIQNSYRNNYGFFLPSSLYVFQSKNKEFDLKTIIYPQSILIKIKGLIFILCIGDGFLCKQYLNGDHLKNLRNFLNNKEKSIGQNFALHLVAFSEILALRMSIRKSPYYFYSEDEIINMSLTTMVNNPDEFYKIDMQELRNRQKEILEQWGLRII